MIAFVVLCVIYAESMLNDYITVEHCINKNLMRITSWKNYSNDNFGGNVCNYHKMNVTINASNEILVEM